MAHSQNIEAAILSYFPAHAHPLTLVSDPDGLLADENVLAELSARGFTLINEADTIRVRYRIEQERPFTIDHPVVIVTAHQVNQLPYDLWQQGHCVTLSLHYFFPNLAYPIVRSLSPSQRRKASQAPPPSGRLGSQATIDHLLRNVFEADVSQISRPGHLVQWLNGYHRESDPMPRVLADALLEQLRRASTYQEWPLDALLLEPEAFRYFMREQFRAYLYRQGYLEEGGQGVPCLLDFDQDEALQDIIPALLRSQILETVRIDNPSHAPDWAQMAVIGREDDFDRRRATELSDAVSQMISAVSERTTQWKEWHRIAVAWAELHTLIHSPAGNIGQEQLALYADVRSRLDTVFTAWLRVHYTPLAVRRLPTPHHVHHVLHYIAYRRRQRHVGRLALLVMDGLSLPAWHLIRRIWQARHPGWRFEQQTIMAQIPTITPVSRQALVSGRRPADFADTLEHNRQEPQHWSAFWVSEELPANACGYTRLRLGEKEESHLLDSPQVHALCLIENSIDDMAHGATLGISGVYASIQVWLKDYSPHLESVIGKLLSSATTVFLTSDHGHVEATGMGQPSEGLVVEMRSKRARLYSDKHTIQRTHQDFPQTLIWQADSLLPPETYVLVPDGRLAFAPNDDKIVTHGGLTLEEVAVPLVTITQG